MELVTVRLPEGVGGGELEALRFQDLPAEQVIAFLGMGPGHREMMGIHLMTLAFGESGSRVLKGMTYAEFQAIFEAWTEASGDAEENGPDGSGLDWIPTML